MQLLPAQVSDSFLLLATSVIPLIGIGLIACLVDLVLDLRRERSLPSATVSEQKPLHARDSS